MVIIITTSSINHIYMSVISPKYNYSNITHLLLNNIHQSLSVFKSLFLLYAKLTNIGIYLN